MRLTVGVPVHNGAGYLPLALESLQAQDVDDVEFLVSDNASDDGTEELCRDMARRDARFSYTRLDDNVGAAGNYNRLVHAARGRYFRWMAHDDLLVEGCLDACLDAFEAASPATALVHTQTRFIDRNGALLERYDEALDVTSPRPADRVAALLDRLSKCNVVYGMIPTSTLRSTRLIGSYPSSDKVLLTELALRGPFVEVPRPLFLRRMHEGQSTRDRTAAEVDEWFDPATRRAAAPAVRTRLLREYLEAVRQAPLPADQRLAAALAVLRTRVPRDWRVVRGEMGRRVLDTLSGAPSAGRHRARART